MTAAKKTIYAKLADARETFHGMKLKKTGWNNFAKYSYFEMADFLIPAMQCLRAEGLVPVVSFIKEEAIMRVYDMQDASEIHISSPMVDASYTQHKKDDKGDVISTLTVTQGAMLKGCHPIQNLGAVETYQRRYLWVALMEIVEHDAIDSQPLDQGTDDKPAAAAPKKVAKKAAAKKEVPKEATPPEQDNADEPFIADSVGAAQVADHIITLAMEGGYDSVQKLADFWKKNIKVINLLKASYDDEFQRVKSAFTGLRKQAQE